MSATGDSKHTPSDVKYTLGDLKYDRKDEKTDDEDGADGMDGPAADEDNEGDGTGSVGADAPEDADGEVDDDADGEIDADDLSADDPTNPSVNPFEPMLMDSKTALANSLAAAPKTVSEKQVETFRDDAKRDLDGCNRLWLRLILTAFLKSEKSIARFVADQWMNNKLVGLAIKPDDGSTVKMKHHHRNVLKAWSGAVQSKFQHLLASCTLGIKTVQPLLTVFLEELMTAYDSAIALVSLLDSKRFRIDAKTRRRLKRNLKRIKLQLLRNVSSVHKIVIVGLEKAAKSSIINAILGMDLLPTALDRCTMVPTDINSSADPGLSAKITFREKAEFEEAINRPIPQSVCDSMNCKTEDEARAKIKKECEPYVGRPAVDVKEADPNLKSSDSKGHGDEVSRDKFRENVRRFITNRALQFVVKNVSVYTNKLQAMKFALTLMDLPGVDSIFPEHIAHTTKAAAECDSFIFATDGNRPALTQPAIDLLNAIRSGDPHALGKGFAVITKLDKFTVESQFNEAFTRSEAYLKDAGFTQIYPICAPLETLRRMKDSGIPLSEEDSSLLDDYLSKASKLPFDGFDRVWKAITQFVKVELPSKRVRDAEELIRPMLDFVEPLLVAADAEIDLIPGDQLARVIKARQLKQFDTLWDSLWTEVKDNANELNWLLQVTKGSEVETQILHVFNSALNRELPLIAVRDLRKLVPRQDLRSFQVDVTSIEDAERTRLAVLVLDAVNAAGLDLGKMLHAATQSFATGLMKPFTDKKINISDACNPYNVVSEDRCLWEIQTLLMRVSDPLIHGVLQWPSGDKKRSTAVEMLEIISAEAAESVRRLLSNSGSATAAGGAAVGSAGATASSADAKSSAGS